mmetsp:Transcript_25607/g.55919  ORF Transcript_25607/g.55919 Transcript_25607/m.55919 type:complete len:534 (+) Transcript_25607:167-1768(+)
MATTCVQPPLATSSGGASASSRPKRQTREDAATGPGAGGGGEDEPPPARRPRNDTVDSSTAGRINGLAVRLSGTAGGRGGSGGSGGRDVSAAALESIAIRGTLASSLRQATLVERREERERLWRDRRRVGSFRRGLMGSSSDRDAAVQWEGGTEAEALEAMRGHIAEQNQQIADIRKAVKKPRQQLEGRPQVTQEDLDEEVWEQRELCISKGEALEHEKRELRDREQRLQQERVEYMRQLQAVEAEDQVEFGSFRMLQQRYQLLRLSMRTPSVLTYRAYDLLLLKHCFVKIHQLVARPSDREAHVTLLQQECEALKQIRHPGIETLLDHFLHEDNSFASVWEIWEGEPLEAYFQRHGPVPEKEARVIILQMLSILRFAESKGYQLDSQELRSCRLIFCSGEVKVGGVALLPCLRSCSLEGSDIGRLGSREPMPDSKTQEAERAVLTGVDGINCGARATVCMVGVTLHEALFAKRPDIQVVGAEPSGPCSQLPDQPRISPECRGFLLRLLDRDCQMTVQDAYSHPFIAPARRQR